MAIKPMLFNTEMTRAILSGQKTCTRRLVKPQPARPYIIEKTPTGFWMDMETGEGTDYQYKPPCNPGDILYVRETWAENPYSDSIYLYRAFPGFEPEDEDEAMRELGLKWRPSIHMPKEAARIFLRVTDVWVERLQYITAIECEHEGAAKINNPLLREDYPTYMEFCKKEFARVWDSTIKPADLDRYGWAANPWVWVIEFERISKEALGGDTHG